MEKGWITCSEQSICQSNTVEVSESGELPTKIKAEFLAEMEKKFDSMYIYWTKRHTLTKTLRISMSSTLSIVKTDMGELCPQHEKVFSHSIGL